MVNAIFGEWNQQILFSFYLHIKKEEKWNKKEKKGEEKKGSKTIKI